MIVGHLEPVRQLEGNLMTVIVDHSDRYTGETGRLPTPVETAVSVGTIERSYREVMGTAPLEYLGGDSSALEELVIQGNTGGVGELINLFDKSNARVVALYPHSGTGTVVDGNTTATFSRSLLLQAEPDTTYTFYVSKRNGETFTNRIRVAGYAAEPQAQMTCTFIQGSSAWVGNHATNTFTTTADTRYLLIFLWSGNEYSDSFVNEVIQTKELQLQKGSELLDYAPYGRCRIPVTVRGKNLFDPGRAEVVYGGPVSGTYWHADAGKVSILFPCKPNTDYAVQKTGGNRMKLSVYLEYPTEGTSCVVFADAEDTATTCVISSGVGARYLSVLLTEETLTAEELAALLATVQIEENTHPTSFAPYTEQTVFLQTEAPLVSEEYAVLSETELTVPVYEGKNTLSVGTAVQPRSVYIRYD